MPPTRKSWSGTNISYFRLPNPSQIRAKINLNLINYFLRKFIININITRCLRRVKKPYPDMNFLCRVQAVLSSPASFPQIYVQHSSIPHSYRANDAPFPVFNDLKSSLWFPENWRSLSIDIAHAVMISPRCAVTGNLRGWPITWSDETCYDLKAQHAQSN